MARTYIDLPSSGTVDMYDDVPLSFNYSIADVREPEKRDTTYSKTITLPGTKNNNKLFDHIFEVGKSGGFNPNVKAKAVVYQDTIPVFDGYMQLTNVSVTDQNEIEYEVVIFGKLANIYTVWADDELKDVDFSDLSHTYNKANITTSWTATVGDGYVYPMIDYGFTDGTYYKVEHFFPALYLKEYIDKIFTYAGYTYTSAFFLTDFFKRLIVPYNGTKLQVTAQELIDRTFEATNPVPFDIATNPGILEPIENVIEFNYLPTPPNPASQYDGPSSTWTVAKTGKYIVFWDTTINFIVNNGTVGNINQGSQLQLIAYIGILKNGSVITSDYCKRIINSTTYNALTNTTVASNVPLAGSALISLEVGDTVKIALGSYNLLLASGLTLTTRVNSGGTFYNQPIADINDGDYLDFNNAIPDRIKIRDLFTSVIKAFNLYIEEDKNTANNLIIEPRDDFYSGGTTFDWTSKLDIIRPLDIRPMGMLDARDYLFTYKEDADYWNDRYKRTFNKVYGDRLISSNNDFLVDTKKTELIFSPSPMVEIPTSSPSNRIVPQIISADTQGNVDAKSSNIRLLYWGGVIGTNKGWSFESVNGNSYYGASFPYAGHLDHPVTPTIDLSFGVPQQIFFIPLNYTNNNLYNKYYKKFITEITDKDSKIVIGYFHLKPIDMLRLDFRNRIFVDGHYYRINKIIDYNPTSDELTKVELLKIKDGISFVSTESTFTSKEISIGDETGMGYMIPQKSNGNTFNSQSQHTVQGRDNYIDASSINVIVQGDMNSVGANSTGVTLLNSSGVTVMPGLSNVTVMNSSGITVSESNQVYTNNVSQSSSNILYASAFLDVGTNADTVEKTLKTYTLPANKFSPDFSQLVIESRWYCAGNGNTKTAKFRLGATQIGSFSGAFNGTAFKMRNTITRTSANTQYGDTEIVTNDISVPTMVYTNSAMTENLATDLSVAVYGTNGTASANDIICSYMSVKIFYK